MRPNRHWYLFFAILGILALPGWLADVIQMAKQDHRLWFILPLGLLAGGFWIWRFFTYWWRTRPSKDFRTSNQH
jgi:hypothetical protein